jgi:hypothetical protein
MLMIYFAILNSLLAEVAPFYIGWRITNGGSFSDCLSRLFIGALAYRWNVVFALFLGFIFGSGLIWPLVDALMGSGEISIP